MSKHPTVPGIDLKVIRDLLKSHRKTNSRLLLATAIDHMKCPAEDADAFLRELATAGYLDWVGDQPRGKDWDLTDHALRLVADDLGPRITRDAVDSIIATVIDRARTINADATRIARVSELRLFGSALDITRENYGDVDIEANIVIRTSPRDEVALAHAKIAAEVPRSWRNDFFRNLRAEENYDRRNVRTALSRGIKGLSLSENTTEMLGCEYRRIYRFDPDSSEELVPDSAVTPRTTPTPKTADETADARIPARTIIRPLGLATPDEALPSDDIQLSMSDLAYDEATTWLGLTGRDGAYAPLDTNPEPSRRFAGARYLFDEWRDPNLTGLELFQRTLDWASLYDLPISRVDRYFKLRTYRSTRIANFHALRVKRVADRIEAYLVLREREALWDELGGSSHITPRMVAAHHALAVAFGRMLDETRLSGQDNFEAEFDLTAQRSNSYPAMPNLSVTSRNLLRALSRVILPDQVLTEARKRKHEYDPYLPVDREVEIQAYVNGDTGDPMSSISTTIGAEWWDQKPVGVDEHGFEIYELLPGEEDLLDVCDVGSERLEEAVAAIPGCLLLSIRHAAPVSE
ncbi:hypothetical protein J2Z31_004198 [Sinorhizobium kostiense]|uniref:Uncharacterized protein n=1 Tax=Sinorhizobium kostiense TaxID=76747 RepID=A0ABS4R5T5_9HYPH|nr:hypothetical protein [Sinorhizobium kostiense]MBP2237675.1 hypothetical protein [Sinorhizobium kostiense]